MSTPRRQVGKERAARGVRTPGLARRLRAFSETAGRLPGVEIFVTGKHRGKSYTRADLDDIVSNFERFSDPRKHKAPLLEVPGVLGHEEEQDLLDRTDLPAAAWAERVYRDGDHLMADLADVPPAVARLLKGKRYKHVSAEIYDDPPEGVPAKGRMLRRIAFLGGEIPHVKTLADIPVPEAHAEDAARFARVPLCRLRLARTHKTASGAFAAYSEVMPMDDRDSMIQQLADMGFDPEVLADVPDPALAEILRVYGARQDDAPPDGGGMRGPMEEYMEGDDDMEPPELPAEEDEVDKYVNTAMRYMDAADKFMARGKRFMEKHRGKYMEYEGGKGDGTDKYAEHLGPVADKYAEITGRLAPAKKSEGQQMGKEEITAIVDQAVADAIAKHSEGALGQLRKFSEENLAAEKKRAVTGFVEEMAKTGRLAPAERDAVTRRLLRADSRTLHKFSENGKAVQKSELDLQMDEIRSRPTAFGERFADPAGGPESEDAEVAKVEAHFERFSEAFERNGTTRDKLVNSYKTLRGRDKYLTAEQFLNNN